MMQDSRLERMRRGVGGQMAARRGGSRDKGQGCRKQVRLVQ